MTVKEQLYALNKMSNKSVALYHKFALSFGLSDSALGILYALWNADAPCSQYALCSERSVPKQTVNSAVTVLQKKGLVCLSAGGSRNKKDIALTEAGRQFAAQTVARLFAAESGALAELTAEERELYVSLNEKYNGLLTEKLNAFLNR